MPYNTLSDGPDFDVAVQQLDNALAPYAGVNARAGTPRRLLEDSRDRTFQFTNGQTSLLVCPESTVSAVVSRVQEKPNTFSVIAQRVIIDMESYGHVAQNVELVAWEVGSDGRDLVADWDLNDVINVMLPSEEPEGQIPALPKGVTHLKEVGTGFIDRDPGSWTSPYPRNDPQTNELLRAETEALAQQMAGTIESLSAAQ